MALKQIRITKGRITAIETLSKYIDPERAEEELLKLFERGYHVRRIAPLIEYQKKNWNLENVLYCLESPLTAAQKNYDVEFNMRRYSCSKTEAKDIIQNFKNKKVTSLAGFVKRHGDEKGKLLFENFQKTSKRSSDKLKEKLISEHGEEAGRELISLEFKRRSMACKEYYLERDYDYEEAIRLAREWNIQNAGVSVEYYKNLGYTEEEINAVISAINAKKANHSRNRKYLKKKYGDGWIYHYKIASDKYRKKMEDCGRWLPLDSLDEFKQYHTLCWWWTRQTLKRNNIKNIESRSRDNHLDHMFSIKEGFVQGVQPKIIGSKYNLKIITSNENTSKRSKCSISLETLLNNYEN